MNPIDNAVMKTMFILLYADDTIIFSNSHIDHQYALQIFSEYCNRWKLKINEEKTKILVFGVDRKKYKFTINNKEIEKVKSFKYLGIIFHKNGRYNKTIEYNIKQARKASFAVFSRARELNLSPSCEIHLLNTIVKPILLYGCELFCFENISELEKFYLNCLKRILFVNKTTLSNAVYGETGCTPLYVDILIRSLSFYLKVKNGRRDTLANTMQNYLHSVYNSDPGKSAYLNYIKRSLDDLGLSYLFLNVNDNEMTIKQINLIKTRIVCVQ